MSNKHDANVRKSTLLNFQIGLIASLLFTYVLFEVYTASPIINSTTTVSEVEEEFNFTMDDFVIEKEPEKELAVKVKPQKSVDLSDPEIVKDDEVIKDMDKEYKHEEPVKSTPVNPSDIVDIDDNDEPVTVPFILVEDVPVFPGCEVMGTNKEKAQCFSEKVGKIVSRKFNTGLGERYGLKGIQRIYTMFEVGSDGVIQNIQIRAPHPKLKEEAERVIKLFPEMTPGKQRGKPVTVKYQLPIVFKIQG
ncbi:energy transducer TonB [Aquimarina algicola]|nr:energy transducer TonB [Aquimarina algicola]